MTQALGQALPGAPAAKSDGDIATLLETLHDLKTKGVLTDAEFAAKKAELLKRLG
jgi:hypothetical protein